MKNFLTIIACSCLLAVLLPGNSHSCGSFRVTADDGSILAVRSMEFSIDLKYDIIVVPRNMDFESPAPDNKKGLKWKTLFGYAGVAVFGMEHGASDGMNEKGLAMSLLWYENDMIWQNVGPKQSSRALAQTYLVDWVLGNFSTVDEVKKNIQNVRVFSYAEPSIKMSLPSHFIVYDAFGGSIVIEYDNGVCNVYDNPLGIMTNAPNFPWQMTNLRQYIGMRTENPASPMIKGKLVLPTGHGEGMIGLPGDYTPPSRFVRFYVLTRYVDSQPDAKGNLNLAQHIINTFDIPQGIITDLQPDGKTVLKELTQWVTFKDLTNRILYFRTYDNFNIRKVDLKALDFGAKSVKRISMFDRPEGITDVTGQTR